MAALSDPMVGAPDLVDLRQLSGRELDPLLLEETVEWLQELDWDFGRSADLVRQFADMRALMGYALLDRGEVAGYGYSVLEDQKGLIGDLYVRPPWRNGTNDARLFRAILDGLIAAPSLRRIESQLMLVDPSVGKELKRERPVRLQERMLMKLDATAPPWLPAGGALRLFYIEPWADHHHEMAASVIALAYGEHIDSQINEQYPYGPRRPPIPVQHRAVSRLRNVFPPGFVRGVRSADRLDGGDRAGELRRRRRGTHHATLHNASRTGPGLGYELLREARSTRFACMVRGESASR